VGHFRSHSDDVVNAPETPLRVRRIVKWQVSHIDVSWCDMGGRTGHRKREVQKPPAALVGSRSTLGWRRWTRGRASVPCCWPCRPYRPSVTWNGGRPSVTWNGGRLPVAVERRPAVGCRSRRRVDVEVGFGGHPEAAMWLAAFGSPWV
jgi:hypothetical protein